MNSGRNTNELYPPSLVWAYKVAIGSISGLAIVAAIFAGFFFSFLTTGALLIFALLTAWISATLRD